MKAASVAVGKISSNPSPSEDPQSCAVALSQARGWLCNASMRGRQRQSRALRRRGRLRPIICVGARNCHQPGGSGIFFRANA
jgi:hypothetical protein